MKQFEAFLGYQKIQERRREAFGDADALYHYRFQNDNGNVKQLDQVQRYVANWKKMQEQNIGLLFWGKPGNGKTFAAGCIANALLETEALHVPSVKMTTFGTILNKLPGLSAQDKEWYLRTLQT